MRTNVVNFIKAVGNLLFPNFQRNKKDAFGWLLFTFILLLVAYFWIDIPYVLGEEYGVISELHHVDEVVQHKLNPSEIENIKNKYLFIDVSKNLTVIPEYTEPSKTNLTIVDRKKLAELLFKLGQNNDSISYVICDVYFDRHTDSATDNTLAAALKVLNDQRKIIVPIPYYNKIHKKGSCIYNVNSAIAQYEPTYNNGFYKYAMLESDSMPQLPLKVFDELTGCNSIKMGNVTVNKDRTQTFLSFNKVVPQFYINSEDLVAGKNYFYMGEFVAHEELLKFENKKIVVIGNFETSDVHGTTIGQVHGALILTNMLESLLRKDNRISLVFVLFTLLIYLLIAYNTVFKKRNDRIILDSAKKHREKLKKAETKAQLVMEWFKYEMGHHRNFVILIAYTIISYFLFHNYLYFIGITIYLVGFEILMNLIHFVVKRD